MPTVRDLADHLAPHLDRERYHREGDPAGVWMDSGRSVERLVLRLDAGPPPYRWASGADAVLIHRPFGLWPAALPESVGVLAVHRALDDRHSIGVNPTLAEALDLDPDDEPLRRDGNAMGLIGQVRQRRSVADMLEAIRREFGGIEETWGDVASAPAPAVALAGAMTDAMVRDAAARGAAVYLTGQLRKPGREAARQTGTLAVAVGQDRAEAWGLRRLSSLLRERWPHLDIAESDLPPLAPEARA